MTPPIPPQGPAVGGPPVLFDPASAARVGQVVKYIEGGYRNPPPTKGGITPAGRPGTWGFLAAGASITGMSGSTLGSGTVTLGKRSGSTLSSSGGLSVTVYNAGNGFTAGGSGQWLKLGWVDGAWSVDVSAC